MPVHWNGVQTYDAFHVEEANEISERFNVTRNQGYHCQPFRASLKIQVDSYFYLWSQKLEQFDDNLKCCRTLQNFKYKYNFFVNKQTTIRNYVAVL